jgi:predicted PhzF superfamily epimerase YddE/YHI9
LPSFAEHSLTSLLDQCGHATLASAAVLFSTSCPTPIAASTSLIRFETLKSGPLTAERRGEKIVLDFPAATGILEPGSFSTAGEYFEIVKTALEKAAPSLEGQVVAVTKTGFGPLVEIGSAVSIEGVRVDTTFIVSPVQPLNRSSIRPS